MIIWHKYPLSIGLSQHASAISSLIVADWPLYYITQHFKQFFPFPEISIDWLIFVYCEKLFNIVWTPVRVCNDCHVHCAVYGCCLMQFTQKCDQLRLLQQTLDEKRSELLRADAKLRETEERFYTSSASLSDKVKDDLRVGI